MDVSLLNFLIDLLKSDSFSFLEKSGMKPKKPLLHEFGQSAFLPISSFLYDVLASFLKDLIK